MLVSKLSNLYKKKKKSAYCHGKEFLALEISQRNFDIHLEFTFFNYV